jgi:hypothetical protein
LRPPPAYIELDHHANFVFTETLRVRYDYMAEEISVNLENSFRKIGKRTHATVNITLPTEERKRLRDQKDNGETKNILGFIGTGLNDLSPESS